MLQNIRDNIQGVAAKIIIAMMIVPFALYGIDFLFKGSNEKTVAVVNGEKVSEQELNQALALQKRRLLAMMGNNIDPSMLDDAVLRKPALDSLVRQKIFLQAADSSGVAVPDKVLNQIIAQTPQFQEDGAFSADRYRQVLATQGFSPQLYRQLLRSDMLIEQLNRGVSSSAFLTDFQRHQAIRLGDQKRSFHYLTLDSAYFASQVQVSDEQVKEYYDANTANFKTPESVRVAYLELDESDFYEPVAEADVRAAYQQEVELAKKHTERHAAHILIEVNDKRDHEQALARIEEAKAKLDGGADFASVAKEYSDDFGSAEQGGDLGYSSGGSFPESFEQALAALQPGQVSAVVETDAGLHLIKLLDVRKSEIPSFDERKPEIERQLQAQAAKPRLVSEVEALRDLVFNADGLEGPAEELELQVKESGWLTPLQSDGLLASPAVKKAVFDAELRQKGYNSEVIEVSPESYVVVHPLEYRAPELKPIESVRAEIVAVLQKQEGIKLAQTTAQAIADELKAGKTAEEIAKARKGVEWQVAVRASRQDTTIPEAMRRQAFSMSKPQKNITSIATTQDENANVVVVQLTAVFDGDESLLPEKRRKELLATAERIQAMQSLNAYFDSLMTQAEIRYN